MLDLPSVLVGYVMGIIAVYLFHVVILPLGNKEPIRLAWHRMWGRGVLVTTNQEADSQ